ncbi:MAG: hypothetical protein HDT28_00830 [Clostridiales bacterium]|nr:hypothetical protein [Clostridiales bacterium]
MEKVEEPTVLFGKSKWIWTLDATKKNSNVIFRRTFSFGQDKPPARAICRVACDTHYYMYVNGNAVVWCGGFNRGKKAYYDEFDIAKYLIKGDNVIVFHCQYYGNSGRDLETTSRAGFIFECNDLEIYSDRSFTVYESRAFKTPRSSNCCYAGWDVNYDASLEGQIQNVLDPSFNSSLFQAASELDIYPDGIIGVLQPRPLPLEKFSPQPVIGKPKKVSDQFSGDKYIIRLPREMRLTPYMEVTGNGQEKITITTDRTACMGSFGDEVSTYYAHSVTYTTKPTLNVFECMLPMTGEELIFSMPRSVKVLKLGYREIGYDTAPTCEFSTEGGRLDTLFKKAQNTLYACMGSTIVDTPERDRSMWLGDASLAARALYLSYFDAKDLVKKIITDIFDYAEDNVLFSCVPGSVPVDIPAHGLLALSEYGLFAQYRNFSGDIDVFRSDFSRLGEYLMLWEMTEHGVLPREGMRSWYDNLYNIDGLLIENALYYSACKFVKSVGIAVGEHEYDEELEDRMANIADYIESTWDGLGYTSNGNSYDDRANALIALAGLVPQERKASVVRLLSAVDNSSPYMEWAVIEALSILGRRDLGRRRFDTKYALLAESESSVLGEDFNGFGSACQSYQSAVIFEAIQLFGGIDITEGAKNIVITPDFRAIENMRVSLKLASGTLDVRYKYSPTRIDIIIDNATSAKLELVIEPEMIGRSVERRTIVINKGKNKFSI